jgi:hypothetical protein
LRKGVTLKGIVVDDPNTPAGHIAIKLFAGEASENHIAYLKFPSGRPIGTRAEQVVVFELKPILKIAVQKW